MDFRDHFVQKALDKAVGRYRPEKTLRSRIARMAVIAAVAVVVFAGFWAALHHSTPKPAPRAAERKPIAIELLPAPGKR